MSKLKQPMQPVYEDSTGVYRFHENAIVQFVLKQLKETGFTLNELHSECHGLPDEDWDQFNQLIGYSIGGIPIRNETTRDCAEKMMDEGLDEKDALIGVLSEKLNTVRSLLKDGISELYDIHPDDLLEED